MLPQRENRWVDSRVERERKESRGQRSMRTDEQEAGYLLRHHLLDLRFHVAVHCFGFKANEHKERK